MNQPDRRASRNRPVQDISANAASWVPFFVPLDLSSCEPAEPGRTQDLNDYSLAVGDWLHSWWLGRQGSTLVTSENGHFAVFGVARYPGQAFQFEDEGLVRATLRRLLDTAAQTRSGQSEAISTDYGKSWMGVAWLAGPGLVQLLGSVVTVCTHVTTENPGPLFQALQRLLEIAGAVGQDAPSPNEGVGAEGRGVAEESTRKLQDGAEANFAAVVQELATRDESRRKSQAALLAPVLDAYLRAGGGGYSAKAAVAQTVGDALARFELTLVCRDQPCWLRVTGESDPTGLGRWELVSKATSEIIATAARPEELPALRIDPAPALGAWQAKVLAQRSTAKTHDSLQTPSTFAPLIAATRVSKMELADQLIGPLRDRVRGMPHGDYDSRRAVCRWINQQLREQNLAVRCPQTGSPCIVKVGKIRNTQSRFIFEHKDPRGKSVRSFTTTDFDTFLENLSLMPADPAKGRHGRWTGDGDSPAPSASDREI